MTIALTWMRPEAPYMPVATVGLLSLLEMSGEVAPAWWEESGEGRGPVLRLETGRRVDELAEQIAAAARPSPDRVDWPGDGRYGQSLRKTLELVADPLGAYAELVAAAAEPEARMLRAIVTDAALDDGGVPARNRLLRGVKSDLSTAGAEVRRLDPVSLGAELACGPTFVGSKSGYNLGFVPEVQTFGGATGRQASTVGAYSPLLYLLIWHGLLALPPIGVRRGRRTVVGGPLVSAVETISWPRWRIPASRRALVSLFCHGEIHAEAPSLACLRPLGIDAVYRSSTVPLSDRVSVFRWGQQVAS